MTVKQIGDNGTYLETHPQIRGRENVSMDIHEAQQNGVKGAGQLEVENFIQDE